MGGVFSFAGSVEQCRAAEAAADGRGVKVAIIDSGIEIGHPDFDGRVLADDLVFSGGAESEDDSRVEVSVGCGEDVFGHGTAVAAALWAVAPAAEVGSFRVFGGGGGAKSVLIARAAREAMRRGYAVLNCSLGCHRHSHWALYKAWLDRAYVEGVHVVAACNNEDDGAEEWPAFFTSVVAVNMVREEDPLVYGHRHGSLVSFTASGVDLLLPWRGGRRVCVSGSSFAAPRVAGALARLLSLDPGLQPDHAKALLRYMARSR